MPLVGCFLALWVLSLLAMDAQGAASRVSCGDLSGLAIENLVCQDAELGALDRVLREVMDGAATLRDLGGAARKRLQASQRDWLESRNGCWQAENPRTCALRHYRRRIAELQVELALAGPARVTRYDCRGEALTLRFYDTSVPSLTAAFRGRDIFMVPPGGVPGRRYAGASLTLELGDGELLLQPAGSADAPLRCVDSRWYAGQQQHRSAFAQCGDRP
ncbi:MULTISPECIES: lysozyme inhibitor LprI family protein [Microbulbifer]|uniref:lysozyme inhibitor LprI family protein n=1 Tax=Microbulbifer TaxID=48073 RepID=UPI001E61E7F6|nr:MULTISPECIES: hypothetical protein [Microbulbifer]UHQ55571.1 hypothetical protein LVE68_00860 [Microbulbifer sp. YPW16]